MNRLRFEDISIGDLLPPMKYTVTQENINQYAKASGDMNPLHIDESFAKTTKFKGTIAHGLMTLAFISQVMTRWHWKGWLYGGEMDVTFISPVRPGDEVTVRGTVIGKENRRATVKLEVVNQIGDMIVVGTTSLSFAGEDGEHVD